MGRSSTRCCLTAPAVGAPADPGRRRSPSRGPGPAPISIRRMRLVFEELSQARTQEFVVRASTRDGSREVVRQQFTFAPPGTTLECEEYATAISGMVRLELTIVPAIDHRPAIATLKEWRMA